MRETAFDHALDSRPVVRQLRPPEREEGRVDVRSRAENLAGHGLPARSFGRELDEHRDGTVRLRPWAREEAIGNLALEHHAPQLDLRQAVQALGDDRRRDVVRKVRDELARRRLERAEIEHERIAPVQLHVVARSKVRLERAVDFYGVHDRDAFREEAREDAAARADLEHDVDRKEHTSELQSHSDLVCRLLLEKKKKKKITITIKKDDRKTNTKKKNK